ncbi:MAG: DUF58 domain-containing protein [Nocardioides sp.]
MTAWSPTAALSRALVVAGLGIGGAVLLGEPVGLVLVAPLVLCAAMGLAARPTSTPTVSSEVDHVSLHEGQGTTSRLQVTGADDAEQVTRAVADAAYVATHPAEGRVSRLLAEGLPDLEISPRRWGRRVLGQERVALTTRWAGYRWGPVTLPGLQMQVLPGPTAYTSRAETPQPKGLVGAHRSARPGSGTEFAGIREFQPGDRLRRINWRISSRTRRLHATTTRAEEDAAVLLVIDAVADHGRSGGVDGTASSLDLTVRAAAALAENAVRRGDRIGLRVVGGSGRQLRFGSGWVHLRRLLLALSAIQSGGEGHRALATNARVPLRATEGTTVVLLTPMLTEAIATVAASTARRGLPTLVIDTLPPDAEPALPDDTDPALADLAWRMRKVEREQVLAGLSGLGCPVVAWRGPGTLDDVLHRLARRAQLPQVRAR